MPGSIHSKEFDAELDVGTIEKVKFLWNNHVVNPTFPRVGAAKITVQKGEEKTVYVPLQAVSRGVPRVRSVMETQPQKVRCGQARKAKKICPSAALSPQQTRATMSRRHFDGTHCTGVLGTAVAIWQTGSNLHGKIRKLNKDIISKG